LFASEHCDPETGTSREVTARRQLQGELLVAAYTTLTMVAAMAVGRFTLGTPLIPELIAQQLFALVTPQLYTATIRLLGFGAKWVAFGLAVARYISGGVVLGWHYARWLRRRGRMPTVMRGCLFGVASWGVIMTLGMPLLGAGMFAVRLRQGAVIGAGELLALHMLSGGLLGWRTRRAVREVASSASEPVEAESAPRRLLLSSIVALPVMWCLTRFVGGLVLGTGRKLAAALDIAVEAIKGLSPEVTP
jgi:hypothetical protein